MSVLIDGMTIPTEGEYRMTLYVCPDGSAYIDVASFPVDKDRFAVIPVPEHGDLIDRDVLKAKQQEDADLFINAYTLMEKSRMDEALNAVANIVNAPTIIPAEGGGMNMSETLDALYTPTPSCSFKVEEGEG